MKRVMIEMYDEGIFSGMTEINSEDLCITYASTPVFSGLQSSYDGDDDRYIEQMKICSQITKLVNRLNEISLK